MTSNTFMNDEDRNNESPVVMGGGDFGEVDSPNGTAPDISGPLSSAEYGTDRPGPHDEDILRGDSGMHGLAEHGYDGTGNLQSAVDSDANTGSDTSTDSTPSSLDSGTEEYSDGSFKNEPNPVSDSGSQVFSTEGIGQTPGSVMRHNIGEDGGTNLSPSTESTGGYGGNWNPTNTESAERGESSSSAGMEENSAGAGSLRDDASEHSNRSENDGNSKDDVMGTLRDKLEDAKHNLFGNDQKR